MRIFGFDLLPSPEHLDHLKVDGELPYPLPKKHFRPEVAVGNYRDHLDAWALMEKVGFDGVGFNEHHTSPYGLMTSPNIMAAAASQRLSRMMLVQFNQGAMPHEMFVRQIERFATEVMPDLCRHNVTNALAA